MKLEPKTIDSSAIVLKYFSSFFFVLLMPAWYWRCFCWERPLSTILLIGGCHVLILLWQIGCVSTGRTEHLPEALFQSSKKELHIPDSHPAFQLEFMSYFYEPAMPDYFGESIRSTFERNILLVTYPCNGYRLTCLGATHLPMQTNQP